MKYNKLSDVGYENFAKARESIRNFYLRVLFGALGSHGDFYKEHPIRKWFSKSGNFWTGGAENLEEYLEFAKSAPPVFGIKFSDYFDEKKLATLKFGPSQKDYGLSEKDLFTYNESGFTKFESALIPLLPKIFDGGKGLSNMSIDDRKVVKALNSINLSEKTKGWMFPAGLISYVFPYIQNEIRKKFGVEISLYKGGKFSSTGSLSGVVGIKPNDIPKVLENIDKIRKEFPNIKWKTTSSSGDLKAELNYEMNPDEVGLEMLKQSIKPGYTFSVSTDEKFSQSSYSTNCTDRLKSLLNRLD
jgi:hypothetical protein